MQFIELTIHPTSRPIFVRAASIVSVEPAGPEGIGRLPGQGSIVWVVGADHGMRVVQTCEEIMRCIE